jgi:hypothetical protein
VRTPEDQKLQVKKLGIKAGFVETKYNICDYLKTQGFREILEQLKVGSDNSVYWETGYNDCKYVDLLTITKTS